METDKRLLNLLAKTYPDIRTLSSEIINLEAILNLPKGTEHFLSDLHGEYEAFLHLRNSASGIIREKIEQLFGGLITKSDMNTLATVIYYPREKMEEVAQTEINMEDWYEITLNRLIELCRLLSSKYTRSKVRKMLPPDYTYIMEELLSNTQGSFDKNNYYDHIISAIVETGQGRDFICAVCDTIKRLAVDRLHIVGDIFDRGTGPDIIMESLFSGVNIDIQWGNHDILWMGAAGGSYACIAAVLNNSITYSNLDIIEIGYGISLRPLALFANSVYGKSDVSAFMPKELNETGEKDRNLIARMHKAIAIMQFKAEAEVILRNPSFNMEDRILLDKIDYNDKTVTIEGKKYPISDLDFPTVDKNDPLAFTKEEKDVLKYLQKAFLKSEKLQRHVDFLFENGDIYKKFNSNLLFHGCVPLNEDGSFMEFEFEGKKLHGKGLMDYLQNMARKGFYAKSGLPVKQKGLDIMWYLWCGKDSPICARKKITTFERLLTKDATLIDEPKNSYYAYLNDSDVIDMILNEFGLSPVSQEGGLQSHIINGHVPVIQKAGENPIKCDGKVIVIDGGFCKAYRKTTGIAGYTLIYSANHMRISAHEPFEGKEKAVKEGCDIISKSTVFERPDEPIRVSETDDGANIKRNINELKMLLEAYESGELKENIHSQRYR